MHQRTPLERSLLAALTYYDVFDYPLRIEELWRWLFVDDPAERAAVAAAAPADVERMIARLAEGGAVERAGAYVTLPGRSRLVATREARRLIGEAKWRRAGRAAGALRILPFVRLIGVVNTLALDNARPSSDIDFLIVVERGRLWLTRLLVTAVVQALGLRRHGALIADRVCLSFYVSDGRLDLGSLRIEDDVHLTYWMAQFIPLYDRDGCLAAYRAANAWVDERLPNAWSGVPPAQLGDPAALRWFRAPATLVLRGRLGQVLEGWTRRLQQRRMARRRETRLGQPTTDVLATDDLLKFHERDRRASYRDAFRARWQAVEGATS